MAEATKPSATAISTMNAGADAKDAPEAKQTASRPTKPDDAAFQAALDTANKNFDKAKQRVDDADAKFQAAIPTNKNTPEAQRLQAIDTELKSIRQSQDSFKTSRDSTKNKKQALDTQLKSKENEQKTAQAQIPYKSAEHIDREIARLDTEVSGGRMKLVDERKAVTEMSNLRRLKKSFDSIDARQKQIDDLKGQIHAQQTDLKIPPEEREMSERYAQLDDERKAIRDRRSEASKGIDALKKAREEARAEKDKIGAERKKLKDDYYDAKRQYQTYDRQQRMERQARYKAEQEAFDRKKKQERAQARLEEASYPAYGEEIRAAESLLRSLDPSALPQSAETGPGEFAAAAQRKVEDAGFKGTKLAKKGEEEDDYFIGTGPKKGKKGKKNKSQAEKPSNPATSSKGLSKLWNEGTLVQFSLLSIDPPSSPDEIPRVVEQLKEKRRHFLDDRDRKTKENIEKAKKDIEKLDPSSDARISNGEPTKTQSTRKDYDKDKSTQANGAHILLESAKKDDAADVTAGVAESSLEDSQQGEDDA